MNRQIILKQLNEIFNDTLDQDNIDLKENTSAADVKDWDSLSHIQLIVAIERRFKLRFKTAEISNFKNVGEMIDAILLKTTPV